MILGFGRLHAVGPNCLSVKIRPASDCRRIAADGLLVGRCHRFRGSLSLRWRGIRQNGSEIGRKKDDLPYVLLFCDSLPLVEFSPEGFLWMQWGSRVNLRASARGTSPGGFRTLGNDPPDTEDIGSGLTQH